MRTLKYVYLISDIAIIYLSLVIAGWLKFTSGIFQLFPSTLPLEDLLLYLALTALFILLFRFQYLYRISLISGGAGHGRRLILAVLVGHTLMVLVFFAVKYRYMFERLFILISLCVMTLLLLATRLIVLPLITRALRRTPLFGQPTLVIGSGAKASELIRHLGKIKRGYYKPAAMLIPAGTPNADKISSPLPLYLGLEELQRAVGERNIREIIIALDREDPLELITLLKRCIELGLPVNTFSDIFSIIPKKLIIDQFDGLRFARFHEGGRLDRSLLKRTTDIVLTLGLLILLSPLLLLIAALIKLTSRGPVFYVDTRVGRDGTRFRMIKFRSMRIGQPDSAHKKYIHRFINSEVDTGTFYKLQDDSRITPVGRVLRRFSLDELPQLFNVLRGEMSLVGPRPSKEYEYEQFDEWHKRRFAVKPGMTGLWQVTARSEVPFRDMIALDIYYAYAAHLWLDTDILLRTVKAIVVGKGAF